MLSFKSRKADRKNEREESQTGIESANGKYRSLIRSIQVPEDEKEYSAFADEGYHKATNYAGVSVPGGYWVYVHPNWYVWRKKCVRFGMNDLAHSSFRAKAASDKSGRREAEFGVEPANGKYHGLVRKIHVPDDKDEYSTFYDEGYNEAVTYAGLSVPEGYWVYVHPYWYVWKKKCKQVTNDNMINRGDDSGKESVDGKYNDLITKIHVPEDNDEYSTFYDEGYNRAERYAGVSVPNGYWVYVFPNWYVWRKKRGSKQDYTGKTGLRGGMQFMTASANGKYHSLIKKIHVPDDKDEYSTFYDEGYNEASTYAGVSVPEGYWVYLHPKWYVWKKITETNGDTVNKDVKGDDDSYTVSVDGKYRDLIKKIPVPEDIDEFSTFYDEGYNEAITYAGVSVPEGYWVYVFPYWYAWRKKSKGKFRISDYSRKKGLRRRVQSILASANRKYTDLLTEIYVPEDKDEYSEYCDEGYNEATSYAGFSVPEGYWVYACPNWYVWRRKDLARIGFEVLNEKVQLKECVLDVHFEYHKENKSWAQRMMATFTRALPKLEERAGISYPGNNPYIIYEDPALTILGECGRTGMTLGSPPKAMEWTLLHEMVHIWNCIGGPHWITEGLADYISYQFMLQFKIPFVEDETLPSFIESWRKDREAGNDTPMNDDKDNFYENKRGKSMDYWQLLYEQYGNKLIDACLRKNSLQKDITNSEFETILTTFGVEDPKKMMEGWVTKGDYHIKEAKSSGSVV